MVRVSDSKTSRNPKDSLLTHALGSCISVMLYDDISGIAGMLHFQLPSASTNPDRAAQNPSMFADTGLSLMLEQMIQLGADPRRLRVRLAGGAEILNDAKLFDIGRRNYTAIRKVLGRSGLLVEREDVGGHQPRTVRMDVSDGAITVKSNGDVRSL